ncbi:uncharacterized protein GGS22DRAFT_161990 [Annulohypoxylon maeteangense]|uniref:uncharacterized protein n=1 Tax=Annulohypoxylon maeteangense TaxID=1927788 RepID=UPI0020077294|nr:uncharacterized protein GGS22DRAFT_161990 [Annulohypoxylon maeteangense]KAI0885781.1 hypothetical protein GGS22DRAFT_161990 [Annulohypoxylon maeteangense]
MPASDLTYRPLLLIIYAWPSAWAPIGKKKEKKILSRRILSRVANHHTYIHILPYPRRLSENTEPARWVEARALIASVPTDFS